MSPGTRSVERPRPDARSIATGAAVAAAVAVPVASIGRAAFDDGSAAAGVVGVLALLGFVAGGWVAGRRQPTSPLLHGAVAALVAFAAIQVVTVVLRLAGDDDVDLVAMALTAILATNLGLVGGWLAAIGRDPHAA